MIKGGKSVDWSVYASRYDLMAGANPAYQELVRHCCETIMKLDISFGGTVADFGAGTGNFSTALALTLPGITVLHIDSNPDMIQHATRKAEALNLQNWHPIILDLESYHLPLPILQAAVTVHTLYTLKNPREAIARICSNLEPGGYIYAADLGRILNLMDWSAYLFRVNLQDHGLLRTLKLFIQGREVRRQNARISKHQWAGDYWLHDIREYRACFEEQGVSVLYSSSEFYRGYDDLVVGQRTITNCTEASD